MPRGGYQGIDWESNIDYSRMKKERLERAKKSMKEKGLSAIICYDFDNIRYITGTHIGEWNRDKMNRYCILIDGVDQPFLFDSAAPSKRLRVDWLDKDHIMPAVGSMRGGIPKEVGMVEQVVEEVTGYLREYGADKGKVGMDITDIPLIRGFESKGIEIVDGQEAMVDARIIKTEDEIQLLKQSAAMVDAVYYDIAKAIRPGVLENELVALANYKLFNWGAERVMFVNSISGERGNPHSHTFSNRMVRPGEIIYMDIGNCVNGYMTCYYRTFVCGKPNADQRKAYEKAHKWIYDAIGQIKAGNTTADVAKMFPAATDMGFKNEEEAFLLQFAHGIGLGLWEKPVISRLFSLDKPFTLEEGMTFAIETWCPSEDGSGSARIEEEIVVRKDGAEIITKFPSEELTSCGLPGCQFL
ncbi:Xaa-Pro peptidase family protein [Ihubacter massiliensis]|uniref:Xaa-Pro peptidase family protein n=1 Tax=Hominibacterium faecale TaxID=2839743 RepID=A0A9J6QZ31_9FIRM|nr:MULTISPECIES: Xaa-Pro peptidase family protein [Eubacteriales Family XIII. Incertae Sedis]MCO7120517.1 Xaa-Pro peptidase family protein [Ihubacter massiliensis]MCU7380724.1 Xaa-Pro peptidase family protein [Hominibacterium faecale]MDE8734744.1 Xaa-Pro peptidase family protein [Eubacteriales bacterium DFI.9.88]